MFWTTGEMKKNAAMANAVDASDWVGVVPYDDLLHLRSDLELCSWLNRFVYEVKKKKVRNIRQTACTKCVLEFKDIKEIMVGQDLKYSNIQISRFFKMLSNRRWNHWREKVSVWQRNKQSRLCHMKKKECGRKVCWEILTQKLWFIRLCFCLGNSLACEAGKSIGIWHSCSYV